MDHHWIKEEHQREFCPYCRTDMNENRWYSEFTRETHYKSTTCGNCNKKIWMPVSFISDGNDTWDGRNYIRKNIKGNGDSIELRLKAAEPKIRFKA